LETARKKNCRNRKISAVSIAIVAEFNNIGCPLIGMLIDLSSMPIVAIFYTPEH
jgi:hypothetical protein